MESLKKLARLAARTIATSVVLAIVISHCSPLKAADNQLRVKLQSYLKPYVGNDLFNGVVLVADADSILQELSYGYAAMQDKIPISSLTKFRIASLSKPFTKLAILQLAEYKALRLSQPLSDFIPDYPSGNKITIQQLVDHQSGIPHLNDFEGYDEMATRRYSVEQVIDLFRNKPLQFDPGTDEAYSNSGYVLLAYIIQKVSGKSYGDYLRENIFEPASMSNSGQEGSGENIAGLASGFRQNLHGPGLQPAQYVDPSIKIGGGSLFSTAEDLYRFDKAYRDGKLSHTTEPLYDEGIFGRTPGFCSVMWSNGETWVIVLSNDYSTPIEQLGFDVVRLCIGQQVSPPPIDTVVEVKGELLDEYVADYSVEAETITIKRSSASLISLEDGDTLRGCRLIALNDSTFYDPRYCERMIFQRGSDGAIDGFFWVDSDEPTRAVRLPD